MHFVSAFLIIILGSTLIAADVQANAQSADNIHSSKPGQAPPEKKRVTIHLESYADAKSVATAHEIAALLEERLSRRSAPLRQGENKKPAKESVLKESTKPAGK